MSENQSAHSLFYSGGSDDALDLTNYVDQVFNVSPVSKTTVPLLSKSTEDVKFDNKLNINFDNLSTYGSENLAAAISPSDTAITLNIENILKNQGVYTAESSGIINFIIEAPVSGDYLYLRCSNNGLINTANFVASNIPLSVSISIAKYQIVVFKCSSSTNSIKSATLIPTGTDINVGEALIDTRDYKAIMAGIGFPDISAAKTLTLPPNKSSIMIETDGYYSISALLNESEYIDVHTEAYGDFIRYNNTNKNQYIFLPVEANTSVYFEYNLNHDVNYLKFIPPVGKSEQ